MSTSWWVTDLIAVDPVLFATWALGVIASICLHELAHGWAAISQGDNTPIELGHMNFNPLVHMGWMSLLVFAIIGIAWGAMPVNPYQMRHRYSDAIVSAAGPAMNLAIAAVCILLGGVLVASTANANPDTADLIFRISYTLAGLNILLAALNLLPFPPLDGSRILQSFFPSLTPIYNAPNAPIISLVALIIILNIIPGSIFAPAFTAGANAVNFIANLF